MGPSLIEAVRDRAVAERERASYPDGFPVLPPVPAARYGDAAFAALEQERVFGRSWLMVAHVDEVPDPGDYRLVDQLGDRIVLVRDGDDTIRAFHNTCMHRGAALVTERAGHAGRRLTCPYHSWSYALDGELKGYPDADGFRDLDPTCVALRSVRCETWGPLVFVCFDPDAPPLPTFLGAVGEDLSELGDLGGRLRLVDHHSLDVPVNWKIPVDANIETYHVNTVHRDSAAKVLDQATTGIHLLPGGHSRMFIRNHDGRSIADLLPFPPLFDGIGDLPETGTFSYHLFPNLSIVFSGRGFLFFITNWPTGPGSSSYHVHFCSSLPSDDEQAAQTNRDFATINRTVLLEDLSVLPGLQRSVDSGALGWLRLGYQERRIYHLHEAIDRAIGVDAVPEPLRVEPVLAEHVEA